MDHILFATQVRTVLKDTTEICRMMIEQKSGLIVNVSSGGGLRYLFNVPYGVGKAAVDRMTQDTAIELKRHNVAVVGIWPGPVKTEMVHETILGRIKKYLVHHVLVPLIGD